ncbi:MAG: lipopolysaccharide export system protein LptA [Candidatus Tokpelaia sp. JSC188]|nr:MAG: lipopolysaccharide export system protein LptA [Candidatus Tokpelaia sp. JSC188]
MLLSFKDSWIWIIRLVLSIAIWIAYDSISHAQKTNFELNLSSEKGSVQIEADSMEVQNKKGTALFQGKVSIAQGERILYAEKVLVTYYRKSNDTFSQVARKQPKIGFGLAGIDKIEASGKVYIKVGKQAATGDYCLFDSKSNTMVLTGTKVFLTDGDNVAMGCRLTAYIDTGKAFLESCPLTHKKGWVSVIITPPHE